MSLTLRLTKGSELTFQELDDNFTYLNTTKYEANDNAQFATLTWQTLTDGIIDILALTNDPTLSSQTPENVLPTEYAVTSYVASYHTNNPYATTDLTDVSITPATSGQFLIWNFLTEEWSPHTLTVSDLTDVDNSTVQDGYVFAYNAANSQWETTSPAALQNVALDDLTDVDVTTTPPQINDVLGYDGNEWVPISPVLNIGELTDVDFTGNTPEDGEALVYDEGSGTWTAGTPATAGKIQVYAAAGQTVISGRAVTIGLQDTNKTVAFPIQYTDPEFGDMVSLGNQLGSQSLAVHCTLQEKILIFYINDTTGNGEVVIAEYDDDGKEITIDSSSPTIWATNVGSEFSVAYDINTTRCVISYRDATTEVGYARVLLLAGFTITLGTIAFSANGNRVGTHAVTVPPNNDPGRIVFLYADADNNDQGTMQVAEYQNGTDIIAINTPVLFDTDSVTDLHTTWKPNTHTLAVYSTATNDAKSCVFLINGNTLTVRTPTIFAQSAGDPFVTTQRNGVHVIAYRDLSVSPPRGRIARISSSTSGSTAPSVQYGTYTFEDTNMSEVRPAVIASETENAVAIIWAREDDQQSNIDLLYVTLLRYTEIGGFPYLEDEILFTPSGFSEGISVTDQLSPTSISNIVGDSRMLIPLTTTTGINAVTWGTNPSTNVENWFGIADETFSSPFVEGSTQWQQGTITIRGGITSTISFPGGGNGMVPGRTYYIDNSRLYRGSLRSSDVGSGPVGIAVSRSKLQILGDTSTNPDVSGIPSAINDLDDVDTRSQAPQSGQFLQWNTNKQLWQPSYVEVQGQINDLDDVDTVNVAPQENYVLAWNAFNGEWEPRSIEFVKPLDYLSDVEIIIGDPQTTPGALQNQDILIYNAITQKWENGPISLSTTLGDITDVSLDETEYPLTTGKFLAWQSNRWVPRSVITDYFPLGTLTDVSVSATPINGQALVYDTLAGEWKNKFIDVVGPIDNLTNVDVTTIAPTVGQALVWNGQYWVPGSVASGGGGTGDSPGGGTGVEDPDDGTVISPPLDPDENADDGIDTGEGTVDSPSSGVDASVTQPLPDTVNIGDLVLINGVKDPSLYIVSIAQDRLTFEMSSGASLSTGDNLTFETPPATRYKGTGTLALATATSDIEFDAPLAEEIVVGHAVFSSDPDTPFVTGISGDRQTITVSYPVNIPQGETVDFVLVIPLRTIDVATFQAVSGTVITFTSAISAEVAIGDFIMYSGVDDTPKITNISQDRLQVSVDKNVDGVDLDFCTIGTQVDKPVQVNIRLDELKDVDISTGALREGELLVWSLADQKWTSTDLQLATQLDALTDVFITGTPTNGQILRYDNTVAGEENFYNVDPLWDVGALAQFSFGALTNDTDTILTWNDTAGAWTPTLIDTFLSTRVSIDDLKDVNVGAIGTGQALVWDGNQFAPQSFPDELQDLLNVSTTNPTTQDALIWTGSIWAPQEIPRRLEELVNLNVFELNQFDSSNQSSGDFIKYQGSNFIGVTPGSGEMGLKLEDLDDVNLTSPYTADFISWDPATLKWVTRSVEGAVITIGLDVLSDVDLQTTPPLSRNVLEYDEPSGQWLPTERQGLYHYQAAEDLLAGDIVALKNDGTIEKVRETASGPAVITTTFNPTTNYEEYGYSVAVNDDLYVVGAPNWNIDQGKIYIYATSTNQLLHTIENPATGLSSRFGHSVSISNDYILVGAPSTSSNEGKAYLYNTTGYGLAQTFSNPNIDNTALDDQFGKTVSVSDSYAVVSASAEDISGNASAGRVYIFNTSTGNLLHNLPNPTPGIPDFGASLSIKLNQYVAVGHPNNNIVYVYEPAGGNLVYTFTSPVAAADFGRAVAITDDFRLLVGAPTASNSDFTSGKVYIYNLTANGAFLRTLSNPNYYVGAPDDRFGAAVSARLNKFAVSAPRETDETGTITSSGIVYVYDVGSYQRTNVVANPEAYACDFGFSIGLTDNFLVIGAPDRTGNGLADSEYGFIQVIDSTVEVSSNAINWVGITEEDRLAGEITLVTVVGSVNEYVSGLTTNTNYYLDGRGFLSQSETPYGIFGKAVDVDRILITGNINQGESGVSFIDDLRDVDTSSVPASNNQSLLWNAATGQWIPGSVGFSNVEGIGDLVDVNTGGLQNGQGLKYSGSNFVPADFIEEGTIVLSDLLDTNVSNPTDGQLLQYNFVQDKWTGSNVFIPEVINDLNDVDTSTVLPIAGQVLAWNDVELKWLPDTVSRVFQLTDLTDVDLISSAPQDGHVIAYDFNQSKWLPVAIAAISVSSIDDLDDVDISTNVPAAGETLIWNPIDAKFIPGSPDLNTITIDSLGDVDTTSNVPQTGQALIWNQATANWEPGPTGQTSATFINDLVDVNLTQYPPKDYQVLTWLDSVNKWVPRDGHSGGMKQFIVSTHDISVGDVVALNQDGTVTKVGQDPGNPTWNVANPSDYGTASNDNFGRQITGVGDYVIVSAPYEDEASETNSGRVYILDKANGNKLLSIANENLLGTATYDRFGESIAAYGNLLAIAAPGEDNGLDYGSNAGVIYIYSLSQANFGTYLRAIDNPMVSGPYSSKQMGYGGSAISYANNLSMGGSYLAAGAPFEYDGNEGSGSGKVHLFNPATGAYIHTYDNPNAYSTTTSDYFGSCVALSSDGSLLAVAAQNEGPSDRGYVYIFETTTHTLVRTLENPDLGGGGSNRRFGRSLMWDKSGANLLAIGTPLNRDFRETTGASYSGLVFIYDYDGDDYNHVVSNPNTYGNSTGDYFGWDVDLDSEKLLASAPKEDAYYQDGSGQQLLTTGTNSGKAYYIDVDSTQQPTVLAQFNNPNIEGSNVNDEFGYSVALVGTDIIIGSPLEEDPVSQGFSSGVAYAFTTLSTTNADRWIGIAHESADIGDPCTITLIGGIAIGLTSKGMTTTEQYYLNTDGSFSTTETGYGIIGRAMSTDTLLITGDIESNTADQKNVLNDLDDVNIINAQPGEGLVWDGFQWEAGQVSGGASAINELLDVNVPSPNDTMVLTWSAIQQEWVAAYSGTSNVAELNDLTDIDFDTIPPANEQILQYNTLAGTWAPADLPRGQLLDVIAGEDINQGDLVVAADTGRVVKPSFFLGELLQSYQNPDPDSNAEYGYSIAANDTYIAVGAPKFDHSATRQDSGKVYVYGTDTSFKYSVEHPLVPATGGLDEFGKGVAVSDDYLIVGVPGRDATFSNRGIIYVYDISNGDYITQIDNPALDSAEYFGEYIHAEGTTLAVGAYNYDDDAQTLLNPGRVYIYDLSTITTNTSPIKTIENPNDEGTGDQDKFGTVVRVSGNYVVAGAPLEDTGTSLSTGRIYVYNFNTNSLTATLVNNAIESGVGFGEVFDTTSTKVAVGVPGYNGEEGIVYIYSLTSGNVLGTITSPTNNPGDRFGSAVAINDEFIIVSSEEADDYAVQGAGKIYVYDGSTFALRFSFDNPRLDINTTDDYFGNAIAISSTQVAVGSYGFNSYSGAWHLYDVGPTAITSDANKWLGVAMTNILENAQGEIALIGGRADVYTGLTPTSYYYANYDGTITPDPTIWGLVGIALNTTDLLIVGSVSGVSKVSDLSDVDFAGVSFEPGFGLVWNGYEWTAEYVSQIKNLEELDNVSAAVAPNVTQGLVWNGTSWIATDIGYSNVDLLGDLSNVSNTAPTNGQALTYNSTTLSWEPESVSRVESINDLSDVVTNVSLASEDILQWNQDTLNWEVGEKNFGNYLDITAAENISAGEVVYMNDDGEVLPVSSSASVSGTSEILHIIYPNNAQASPGYYGGSADFINDIIVIGDLAADNPGAGNCGEVSVYRASSGDELFLQKGPLANSNFGRNVATNGTYVASSTSQNDVYVYDIVSGNLVHTISRSQITGASAAFGYGTPGRRIAMRGEILAISDNSWSTGGFTPGKVWLYNAYTGNLLHEIDSPAQINSASFGDSIDLNSDGSILAVSDRNGNGLVYAFNTTNGTLISTGEGTSSVEVGREIAVNDNYIVASEDSGGGSFVTVFSIFTGDRVAQYYIPGTNYNILSVNETQFSIQKEVGSIRSVLLVDIASGQILDEITQAVSSFGVVSRLDKTKLLITNLAGQYNNVYDTTPVIVSSRAADWLGIAADSFSQGEQARINTTAALNTRQSNLLTGYNYYVAYDGSIFPGPTGFGKIGRAVSSTSLIISSNTSNIDLDEESTQGLIAGIGDLQDVDTFSIAPTTGDLLTWDSGNSLWVPGTTTLANLSDTSLSNVSDNELLVYSGSSWQNGSVSIGVLTDVDITTNAPTDGQTLTWSDAESKFIPADLAANLGDLGDVTTAGAAQNYILIYDEITQGWFPAENATTVEALTDTDLTGLADEDILQYNAVTGFWEPASIVTALSELSDVDLTGLVDGQFIAYNNSSGKWEPATLEVAVTLGELTDVADTSSATDGQGIIFNSQSGLFELATVGTSNVDALADLSNVSAASPNDGDVLKYDQNSGAWIAAPQPSPVTFYANSGLFPATGNTGDLVFAEDEGVMYVWDGTAWYNLKRTNAFYLVRAGSFSGPLIGEQVFQPSQLITLLELRAQVDIPSGQTLVFDVVKNGTAIQQFAIPATQGIIEATFTAGTTVGIADEISVDIVSGPGTNLSVKFIYA